MGRFLQRRQNYKDRWPTCVLPAPATRNNKKKTLHPATTSFQKCGTVGDFQTPICSRNRKNQGFGTVQNQVSGARPQRSFLQKCDTDVNLEWRISSSSRNILERMWGLMRRTHGQFPQTSMDIHEYHGYLWIFGSISMGFRRYPRISMNTHGHRYPYKCVDFYGYPMKTMDIEPPCVIFIFLFISLGSGHGMGLP